MILHNQTGRSIPESLLRHAQAHARAAHVIKARQIVVYRRQCGDGGVAHAAQLIHLWEVEPDVA